MNFSRDLNVKYGVTRNALKSQSGARVRILFDGQEILAELKGADLGSAYIIFKTDSGSRHRHVLSDKEVDELFQERAGILVSRISLRSLEGRQPHGVWNLQTLLQVLREERNRIGTLNRV